MPCVYSEAWQGINLIPGVYIYFHLVFIVVFVLRAHQVKHQLELSP